MAFLNSDVIGLALSAVVVVLLLASIALPLALQAVRAAAWPLWLVLGLSAVAQVGGLVIWWVTAHVDEGSGPVLCMNFPITDIGRDAGDLEMGGPLCYAASVDRVVIGTFVLVVAYGMWALAVAYASRHRPAAPTRLAR